MYKNKTFLAIIPARGGSKRLPNKNILDLNGKPLVLWSVDAGLKSQYIDKVVVTSDNYNILNISRQAGAMVIDRPTYLANDTATTFAVVEHTINNIEYYDYVVLLQPTSPLRNETHIDEAIELLLRKSADSIISVCETNHSPLWSNVLPKNCSMSNFIPESLFDKRSQDLETYYRLNGAIYICDTNKLMKEKGFFLKKNIFAYRMDKNVSIDIDEEVDIKIAGVLL